MTDLRARMQAVCLGVIGTRGIRPVDLAARLGWGRRKLVSVLIDGPRTVDDLAAVLAACGADVELGYVVLDPPEVAGQPVGEVAA